MQYFIKCADLRFADFRGGGEGGAGQLLFTLQQLDNDWDPSESIDSIE